MARVRRERGWVGEGGVGEAGTCLVIACDTELCWWETESVCVIGLPVVWPDNVRLSLQNINQLMIRATFPIFLTFLPCILNVTRKYTYIQVIG